jgi:phosphoglycolate phosphatase
LETQTNPDEYAAFHGPEFGKIKHIVWDGDNTIWDWIAYAVPAYEAMAQTIADETGKPEPEVAAAMKEVYSEVGTMEYTGLIQYLNRKGFFKDLPGFDQDGMILKVQKVFSVVRRKNLHSYKGIYKTMKTIHEHGIHNRILTDAPAWQAMARIKKSRMGWMLEPSYAMQTIKTPDLPAEFRRREQAGEYDVDFTVYETTDEKPYTDLEKILKMTREQIRKHVLIIGDNDQKDMALVRKYGCRGIHAAYGVPSKEMLDRLLRFAPEKIVRKNMATTGAETSSPTATTASDANPSTAATAAPNNQGLIIKINNPREIMKVLGITPDRKW